MGLLRASGLIPRAAGLAGGSLSAAARPHATARAPARPSRWLLVPTTPRCHSTSWCRLRGAPRHRQTGAHGIYLSLAFPRQTGGHGGNPRPARQVAPGLLHRPPPWQAKVKKGLTAEGNIAVCEGLAPSGPSHWSMAPTTVEVHVACISSPPGVMCPDPAGAHRLNDSLTFPRQTGDHGGNPRPAPEMAPGLLHRPPPCQAKVKKGLTAEKNVSWLVALAPAGPCRLPVERTPREASRTQPRWKHRLNDSLILPRQTGGHGGNPRPACEAAPGLFHRPPPCQAKVKKGLAAEGNIAAWGGLVPFGPPPAPMVSTTFEFNVTCLSSHPQRHVPGSRGRASPLRVVNPSVPDWRPWWESAAGARSGAGPSPPSANLSRKGEQRVDGRGAGSGAGGMTPSCELLRARAPGWRVGSRPSILAGRSSPKATVGQGAGRP
jgi:hypothetical protein